MSQRCSVNFVGLPDNSAIQRFTKQHKIMAFWSAITRFTLYFTIIQKFVVFRCVHIYRHEHTRAHASAQEYLQTRMSTYTQIFAYTDKLYKYKQACTPNTCTHVHRHMCARLRRHYHSMRVCLHMYAFTGKRSSLLLTPPPSKKMVQHLQVSAAKGCAYLTYPNDYPQVVSIFSQQLRRHGFSDQNTAIASYGLIGCFVEKQLSFDEWIVRFIAKSRSVRRSIQR